MTHGTETFAVALLGETDAGWLVDAASGEEAIEIVHGTVPRAREVCRSELLAWAEEEYRNRHLLEVPFPASCPPSASRPSSETSLERTPVHGGDPAPRNQDVPDTRAGKGTRRNPAPGARTTPSSSLRQPRECERRCGATSADRPET